MPGVGKTTMMEQVRRAMVEKKEFEEVAVAVVSATLDVKSIQRKLANDLGLSDLAKEDDESVRACLLRRRLKNGKKILVILDDVWDKLPLEDMGLDFGDSRGCKILISSREKRVCEANKCLPFLIHVLSNEEARVLFRQHAGNCIEDAGINPVAMAVLNECGGLPLIIRAVGEALKDGELFQWNDAERQFKNFTPRNIVNLDDQVYKTLELSFDKLKPEEAKSCLLLCSTKKTLEKIPSRFFNKSHPQCELDSNGDVYLPSLEELHLQRVGISLSDIIGRGHRAESFCKLRRVMLMECEVPANLLVLLQNLQELQVENCVEARELFDLQGLNALEQHVRLLSRMSMLEIDGLPKLQSLWNGDPLGILDLRSLTEIKIENCGLLKMLFSCSVARALEQLRQLTVADCPMMETIVYDDEGKEGTCDDIEFPRLKILRLAKLPKLSSFCSAKVSGPLHMRKTTKEHLEVFFPSLEHLQLRHVGFSPLEIGHRAESFCNLRYVNISLCEASTLVSPNWLHNLQELRVESCDEARELFDLQGLNAREQHVRLLSRMSMLKIDGLPKLQSLWNRDPRGILDLQSLTEIKIKNCGLLKMLFSCSVARALKQLRQLIVACCPMLETIVYDDKGKEGTGDDIVFPLLKFLYLEELPKLSSFCNAKDALIMYSLKAARLRKCPQMLRFSFGGLHLPKMTILSSPARSSHVADLKEHLQASAIKINNSDFDDKELATEGEGLAMDKDSDGKMDLHLVVEGLTRYDEAEMRRVFGDDFYEAE
ncbi:hypothetical protein RJ640_022442 [Escallonia rubra]|uniref:NB-ARC domain-containing protein n=1 Tax=Escallonia rubra TaxID=112253 RepID=A0AA88UIR6_9ASTE|nr:hypothetical protein RJ640_022442 [Escallonia rubra]